MLLSGCSVLRYSDGPVSFSRWSLGSDLKFKSLKVTVTPHGKSVQIEEGANEQSEALGAVAKGIAEGMAKGLGP